MSVSILNKLSRWSFPFIQPRFRRLLLPVLLTVLLLQTETRELVLSVLSDAFWQVAVFVAATLVIYHIVSQRLVTSERLKQLNVTPTGQVFFASFMGAIPGCGGAIIVITQFISGSMRFGSVVAVLTATMGDAAFLLIASQPVTGAGVIAVTVVAAVISGLIVNSIHSDNFLRPISQGVSGCSCKGKPEIKGSSKQLKLQGGLWRFLLVPGAVVGLLMSAQVDLEQLLVLHTGTLEWLGAAVALLFIFLWATTTEVTSFQTLVAEDKKALNSKLYQKVAMDTNFVTSWVVIAFLVFELLLFYSTIDIAEIFGRFSALTPFIAVLIGMIPGCGPQIVTTTLYLNGSIPLSAQIGNAISNDGDALFPAIALSPKIALWATLYSAVPALAVAYSYYFLFE